MSERRLFDVLVRVFGLSTLVYGIATLPLAFGWQEGDAHWSYTGMNRAFFAGKLALSIVQILAGLWMTLGAPLVRDRLPDDQAADAAPTPAGFAWVRVGVAYAGASALLLAVTPVSYVVGNAIDRLRGVEAPFLGEQVVNAVLSVALGVYLLRRSRSPRHEAT